MPVNQISLQIIVSLLFAIVIGVLMPPVTQSAERPALMRPELPFIQHVMHSGEKGWCLPESDYPLLVQYIVGLEHEYQQCHGTHNAS